MKRLFCMAMLVTCVSAYGSIFEITHPASICPSDNPLFKVRYFYFFNTSGPPQERVLGITWQFIQNGKVIRTLNSVIFDRITFFGQIGEGEVFAGNLPSGTLTAKVTITTLTVTFGGSVPRGENFQKSFTVGIKKPASISGPSPICPGQTYTFSTPALDNATSYTWQVPSGWYVNGIPGPVVTGQGNVVNITSDPYGSGTGGISVSGQSTSCGSGIAYTRYFDVDYQYSIYAENLGGGDLRLSVQGAYSSLYSWQIPGWWTVNYDYGSYIEVSTNGSGTAGVTVLTPCGNYQTIFYHYTASGCDPNIQVYPTYFEDYLMVDPGQSGIMDMQMMDYYGNYMILNYWWEGNQYRIDTAWFPRTMYILRVTDWNGCTTEFQVAKLPY